MDTKANNDALRKIDLLSLHLPVTFQTSMPPEVLRALQASTPGFASWDRLRIPVLALDWTLMDPRKNNESVYPALRERDQLMNQLLQNEMFNALFVCDNIYDLRFGLGLRGRERDMQNFGLLLDAFDTPCGLVLNSLCSRHVY